MCSLQRIMEKFIGTFAESFVQNQNSKGKDLTIERKKKKERN